MFAHDFRYDSRNNWILVSIQKYGLTDTRLIGIWKKKVRVALVLTALTQGDSKINKHFQKLWWALVSSGDRNAYNFQKEEEEEEEEEEKVAVQFGA